MCCWLMVLVSLDCDCLLWGWLWFDLLLLGCWVFVIWFGFVGLSCGLGCGCFVACLVSG